MPNRDGASHLVVRGPPGALLIALEVASSFEWLLEGRGLAVLAKLGVLALVPFFWNQRVPLLLLVVTIASVGSHMPARFRHRSVRPALEEAVRRLSFSADPPRGAPPGR